MGKGEISWKRRDEDGEALQIYARRTGHRWHFFVRQRRYDNWQPLLDPPLEDWIELLDGVRRRAARRLMRPEEVQRVQKRIQELFP